MAVFIAWINLLGLLLVIGQRRIAAALDISKYTFLYIDRSRELSKNFGENFVMCGGVLFSS